MSKENENIFLFIIEEEYTRNRAKQKANMPFRRAADHPREQIESKKRRIDQLKAEVLELKQECITLATALGIPIRK